MMKYILIIIMCVSLNGCFLTGAGETIFDVGDKQSSSSESRNLGNGAGRDIGAKVALNAGDDKSNTYKDSNIKSDDKNTDNNIKSSLDKTNFSIGGNHKDYSQNEQNTKTDTRSKSDDTSYDSENMIVNMGERISNQVIRIIESNLNAIIVVISFMLGGYISLKRRDKYIKSTKVIDDGR